MQILIATSNPGKVRDIKEVLDEFNLPIEIKTLADFEIQGEPIENGKTLEENASIKARFYGEQSGVITLADDTGFEIEALNKEPGIYVRRWIDISSGAPPEKAKEASDEELIRFTLEKMKDIPKENRKAQFRTVVALYDPKHNSIKTADGVLSGYILEKDDPLRIKGFPFESLLFIEEAGKVMGKLTPEERHEMKHRSRSVKNIVPYLKEII